MTTYKSDKDIAGEFDGLRVVSHEKTTHGGYITCIAPNAGDHVAGGAGEFTDHYIVYDDGRVAFDNWYPESAYNALVDLVRECERDTQGTTSVYHNACESCGNTVDLLTQFTRNGVCGACTRKAHRKATR